ncbi:tight adherence pilus pseudopilin TadF [Vibrio vulnificus]|uniref:tight adherence pilus pseudopilin TadF n=1 Tax=Vibrio vulnificus TaxID=672 RepID=UPI000A39D063|nr:tight adherence pilus pseudopilin TadF [Vibrio vulnificus]EGQ7831330.1 pilus assembly protein TadF [Vibrio vulnificus]EGQ7850626.1 pilus assembly protein TadF [Vibrio vulnificus]EGQ8025617.1 pilus assembly protein TadF [Vibrio vulnificus]EGQ8075081.1 pilus assembly protein TadF [Vibrio vulnificus]EGQ8087313.1 pilus assembly protein TadF [Vibrio vulnificus]
MKAKQQGAFMVELALVLMFISGLFVVMTNYVVAINTKGQLDRAVYSLTTIMAERKQFFDGDLDICGRADPYCSETKRAVNYLSKASLKRMMPGFDESKFGVFVEQLVVEGDNPSNFIKRYKKFSSGVTDGCNLPNLDSLTKEEALELLPITSRNRRLPMYQITLCYETPFNIFGLSEGNVIKAVSTSFSFARV